jgi:hypothetical protein
MCDPRVSALQDLLISQPPSPPPGAGRVSLITLANMLRADPANQVRVVGSPTKPDAVAVTMPACRADSLKNLVGHLLRIEEDVID